MGLAFILAIWLACALPALYYAIEDRKWDGRFGVQTLLVAVTCAAIAFALIGAYVRG